MVSLVQTPLLLEAKTRLGQLPRGGVGELALVVGLPVGRLRQMAKGLQPTGSRHHGPTSQQVQRVVYELRRMQDKPAQDVNQPATGMAEMPLDRSNLRAFAVGTSVRFKADYLAQRPDAEKRFLGRAGVVTGYRLGAADPIVEFPRDGRRKEVKLFEVPSSGLEVVN